MKICIIGNSVHGMHAYEEMKRHPQAEFVGVAAGSADEYMPPVDGIEVFPSYGEMLDKVSPDMAIVAPVTGYTGRIIIDCANRGISVLAEKPVAATIEELDEVERAVKGNGIRFCAMHFLRFMPNFYHAMLAVRAGAIGDVRLITVQKSYKYGIRPEWYKERSLYTGTIPWIGIHAIDWISAFSGKKFLSVSALHNGNPEMTALCQFELEDGVLASVNIDYLRPESAATHGDDRLRAAGTRGIIEVYGDKYFVANGEGENEYTPHGAPELAYDFLDGKEPISAGEAFMLTRVALCARQSADTQKRIKLNFTGDGI